MKISNDVPFLLRRAFANGGVSDVALEIKIFVILLLSAVLLGAMFLVVFETAFGLSVDTELVAGRTLVEKRWDLDNLQLCTSKSIAPPMTSSPRPERLQKSDWPASDACDLGTSYWFDKLVVIPRAQSRFKILLKKNHLLIFLSAATVRAPNDDRSHDVEEAVLIVDRDTSVASTLSLPIWASQLSLGTEPEVQGTYGQSGFVLGGVIEGLTFRPPHQKNETVYLSTAYDVRFGDAIHVTSSAVSSSSKAQEVFQLTIVHRIGRPIKVVTTIDRKELFVSRVGYSRQIRIEVPWYRKIFSIPMVQVAYQVIGFLGLSTLLKLFVDAFKG